MTILSFELSTDFTSTLIGQGAHTGKIIGTEIITNVRPNNETQFCLTWKINNTTFMDKFKLWAHKENTKNYAHQKLDTLFFIRPLESKVLTKKMSTESILMQVCWWERRLSCR